MENPDILEHLLKVESEAAALARDAETEAERRKVEAEKQNRQRYEETYAQEVSALEERYKADMSAVKEAYKQQLDEFTASLDAMKTDKEQFNRLLEGFLFEDASGGKKG